LLTDAGIDADTVRAARASGALVIPVVDDEAART
jgi:hypothetical protein